MSDLIFREDALAALGNEPPKWNKDGYGATWEDGRRTQWVNDRKVIKEIPTAGKEKRTNLSKYKEEIKKVLEDRYEDLAIKDGKPTKCRTISCSDCDLSNTILSCRNTLIEWLCEEE